MVLYHGTDTASATDIAQNGVHAAKAARYNSMGEFWATMDPGVAEWFARANIAGGPPACVRFELPEAVLQTLLTAQPLIAQTDGQGNYEFFPASFPVLNQNLSGLQVIPIP